MPEDSGLRWTVRNEQRVAVPDTVDGIRAALSEEQLVRFEEELGRATAETVASVVRHWVLNLASDPEDEDEFARLEAENRGRGAV
ncbi:hypothetical protein ACIQNG_34040 [Streptomyces sp. NPDC091377]|uniref:hypothetical protein n=1 Tax=Streptomyces sp. NPDC091377 TaxID=3365995 RepID=UPI00380A8D7B